MAKQRSEPDHRLKMYPYNAGECVATNKEWGDSQSTQEHTFYINYLELLAATLAVQTFIKHKTVYQSF